MISTKHLAYYMENKNKNGYNKNKYIILKLINI